LSRSKLILLLGAGLSYAAIERRLGCSQMFIKRWRRRFLGQRLEGLYGRHRGGRPAADAQRLEARILTATQLPPPDGSTHWSSRKLAKHLGISHIRVARVWARARLKPHRLERYLVSNDPDFETKAADVIGLYVNPPQHAIVFSLDEKTAIQALDRRDPILPLSPGRAERHGFEYMRRGGAMGLPAASSRPGMTSSGNCCATSASTTKPPSPSSGVTPIPATGFVRTIPPLQATRRFRRSCGHHSWRGC